MPFDCSKLKYLKKFKLTKEHEINRVVKVKHYLFEVILKNFFQSDYPKDLIFVSGVDSGYYPSFKAAFATVRKHFGPKNKFILYDLGDVNKTFVSFKFFRGNY